MFQSFVPIAFKSYTPGNTPPIPNPPVWIPGDITQATFGAATLLMAFLVVVLKYREPLRTLAGECYVVCIATALPRSARSA